MSSIFLEVKDLAIDLSGNQVIKNMNFKIQKNTLTTFLGPSGSGKTTVLRAIAGLNQKISGQILLDGEEIQNLAANQRNIGMIFQSYALFPNMSVFENVAYGLRVRKEADTVIKKKVDAILKTVNLQDKEQSYPENLSGGQKQRVAIARAMVLEPKILLLDEPLSALDAKIRIDLRNQIREYQQRLGITMLFVTHDQAEAMAISDEIIVMDNGKVQQKGSPLEIYTHPQNLFMAKFIGNHNILSAEQLRDLGVEVAVDNESSFIIRPELFQVNMPKESNDYLAISGKIKSVSILGDRFEYRFITKEGLELKAEFLNQQQAFTKEKEVVFYVKKGDIKKVGI
ncbi:ABC transporter ATP-binding protein [Liquorilactobacillus hordei]|uniref:ABC-type quaternary amine transporter n=1 Tax=Liquorilactobacillus hordei DSM 19519 TaxID=1423759 RepID=A0A0R1MJM9_9LACO|nr:ABC transporter ATP-binding protein [Liquorilactobacillus hordei]KRL08140.1 ABC transporter ATP-binding protein [Liquorilactobacillus hordei DSM 19519]QYH51781.1 ABC transporter ATP-binding protein [Liquorilactobacillus hordei DSM 19519]